jgi:multiple sugar transport system permease protein
MMKHKSRLFVLLTGMITFLFLFPVIVTVASSFMSQSELSAVYGGVKGFRLIPNRVTVEGYVRVLFVSDAYLNMFWNSLFISAVITACQVFVSVVVAYVLAKNRFRGRGLLLFAYTAVMMMPFQVTLLPHYLMAKQLGLYNTWWSVILPAAFSPFGVMVLYLFYRRFPDEVLEAALLETSSRVRIMARVILPAVRPGMIVVIVLAFADSWNMVEQPLILLRDAWLHPLSLALNSIRHVSPSVAFSGAVLYALPVVILYALCKNELTDGIAGITMNL